MSDIYMEIADVPGESTDADHDGWIEILAMAHDVHKPADPSAPGHTSGHSNHGAMSITKKIDKATAKLWEACCSGANYGEIKIEFVKQAGDSRVKFFDYTLTNCSVTSANVSAASGDSNPATEHVAFVYETIKWNYTEVDVTGSAGGTVEGNWNLSTNAQ